MRRVVATAVKVLLAVVGVVVLALVGVILFDTLMPSQRVTDFTNVTFTDAGGRPPAERPPAERRITPIWRSRRARDRIRACC